MLKRACKPATQLSFGVRFQEESNSKMKNIIIAGAIICSIVTFYECANANEMELVQSGTVLFTKHCAHCHGDDAIGQDPTQPSGGWDDNMSRLAPALNGTGHAWHHPPELIYEYIEKGSIDKTSPMPSFGSILKDNDIKSIIAYINSLWPDEILDSYRKRFAEEE